MQVDLGHNKQTTLPLEIGKLTAFTTLDQRLIGTSLLGREQWKSSSASHHRLQSERDCHVREFR
jgi:hypothetical protein